jgi:LCP family protein required for cell wall assembly
MTQRLSDRAHRVRRAELISLASALVVFVIVLGLGVLVWRRSAVDSPTVVQAIQTVAVPRQGQSASVVVPKANMPMQAQFSVAQNSGDSSEQVKTPNPLNVVPDWPENRPFGILFMGLDRRPGESTGRTDAMILARVDPQTRSVTLISIPRDICIANCRTDGRRINEVWWHEGPVAMLQKVSDLLGVQADYWITMDFSGFRRLVDFFGGVEIDVLADIYDFTYPNATDTGFEPFNLESGIQHLDGDMALRYIRSRRTAGNFGRDERQRQMVVALAQQAISPQVIIDSPALLYELNNAFESNIPPDVVPSMAKLILSIGPERTVQGGITYTQTQPIIDDKGKYVLIPNVPIIHSYVAGKMREIEKMSPLVNRSTVQP